MKTKCLVIVLAMAAVAGAQMRKTQNIVLVTADGLRRQEVFGGIDANLMYRADAGMDKAQALRRKLWAETAEERRQRLMPFLWRRLAPRGVVLGNIEKGSTVEVTNAYRVSYPGYSELLTCRAQDEQIRGNDPIRNPHQTVLEFLRDKWGLEKEQAALFGSWDTFRFIGESREGAVSINAGYQPAGGSPRLEELSRVQWEAPTGWDEVRHDYITAEMALEYLKRYKPRVLYVSLGETDDWAHGRRYDRVLEMAQYFDRALERLWETLQSMPEYRDKTTLLAAADHGRGGDGTSWLSHGREVAGAQYIWMAALGPDTPPRGEAANAATVHQRDMSATILALVGLDWREFCGSEYGRPVELIAPAP